MSGLIDILEELYEYTDVVADFTSPWGENQRFKGLLEKKIGAQFHVILPPQTLPQEIVKTGVTCLLSVKHDDKIINLLAKVDNLLDDQTISMTAMKPINPEALREYFRVTLYTTIKASYTAGEKNVSSSWDLTGQTVDLSGSGVLAVFAEKPKSNKHIQLRITLPGVMEPVLCQAHVIRTYRLRKGKYQVAFHFDSIDGKTRDTIISNCLREQRRQLRHSLERD